MNGERQGPSTPELACFLRERAELDAVLNSRAFSQTPTLARFLSYVCECHFEGRSDQIKEYTIAVEALARPANFNPAKDSVVRVEAHRLRKRLSRYYQTEGADRPLEIIIHPGHYHPDFVPRRAMKGASAPADESEAHCLETTPEPARLSLEGYEEKAVGVARAAFAAFASRLALPRLQVRILGAVGAIVVVGLALAQVFGMLRDGIGPPQDVEQFPSPHLAGTEAGAMRILAGSWDYPYADTEGRNWVGDRFFSGGQEVTTAGERIHGGWDDQLFRTHRTGNFRYDIPLKPDSYEMSLYFSERVFGPGNPAGQGEVSRLFNVLLNGAALLKEFDIIADAGGPNKPAIRVFRDVSPAADGFVHLEFQSVRSQATLSAIEFKPMVGGKTAPIRILAGRSAYVYDADGRAWGSDRYFEGGRTVPRLNSTLNSPDPTLYAAERYGNFRYVIPVAEGAYTVKLHFVETWWGDTNPGGGGEGSRVFDVQCNGMTLLEAFDVYREAGGENRALVKTFQNIKPTPQGRIELSFIPRVNYALINAIEVLPH